MSTQPLIVLEFDLCKETIKFTDFDSSPGHVTLHHEGEYSAYAHHEGERSAYASISVRGNSFTQRNRNTQERILLRALHLLHELGVTDLGHLDNFTQEPTPTKAPAPDALNARVDDLATDASRAQGESRDSLASRVGDLEITDGTLRASILSTSNAVADLDTRHEVVRDSHNELVGKHLALEGRVTPLRELADTTARRVDNLAEHARQVASKLVRMEAAVSDATDHAEDARRRILALEYKATENGTKLRDASWREASWLYQAVNITLDNIDDALPSLTRYSENERLRAERAGTLKRHENTAVLRDLIACNSEARDIYDAIVAFEMGTPRCDESHAFYVDIRAKLMKFATDMCTRLGIPPAPPNY